MPAATAKVRAALKFIIPPSGRAWIRQQLRLFARFRVRLLLMVAHVLGLNIARAADFYSPLPVLADLRKNKARWYRSSQLVGVAYDVAGMQSLLERLHASYGAEFAALPPYEELATVGYGPGFTPGDALTQYLMLRDLKPRRYLEIGSGLSTYYCSLASMRNKEEGSPLSITCVEPFPFQKLYDTPGVEKIIKDEVQNVDLRLFETLESGDVLFIDGSHSVRIDGDVPHMMLEVLPRLRPGVVVHIHDIPFPYNVPRPADYWVFETVWPHFWTEAMLVQSFLAFNNSFRIRLSLPLLRHHDEPRLAKMLTGIDTSAEHYSAFTSLWMERVA